MMTMLNVKGWTLATVGENRGKELMRSKKRAEL